MTKRLTLAVMVSVLAFTAVMTAAASGVTRTTKEELKAKMDRGEPVVIVDVRQGADWMGSEFKIQGAVRLGDVETFAASQPKDAEIVLYCA